MVTHRRTECAHIFGVSTVALLLLSALVPSTVSRADVIVLANRSGADVPLRFVPKSGAARQLTIPPDETVPLFLDGKADLTFATRGATKHYALDANGAYFFGRGVGGQVDMQKIGLGEDGTAAEGRKLPGSAVRMPTVTIPVKICVDEEEPARDGIWGQRYRRRIEAASASPEKH